MHRCFSLGSLAAILGLALNSEMAPGHLALKPAAAVLLLQKARKAEALAVTAFDGVVKGKVILDGIVPVMGKLKIAGHADEEKCLAGKGKDLDQTWLVGKDGGVANVAVILEAPEGKFFSVDEEMVKKYRDPWIDQPYCVYEPQLVGLFAAYRGLNGRANDTGLTLLVKNSGAITHDIIIKGELKYNPAYGRILPPGTTVGERFPINYQKSPVDISSHKHPWMSAKLLTFDHPFFAVTKDDGSFEIRNVPTGVEVTVKLWHKAGTAPSLNKTFTKGDNDLPLKIKAAP